MNLFLNIFLLTTNSIVCVSWRCRFTTVTFRIKNPMILSTASRDARRHLGMLTFCVAAILLVVAPYGVSAVTCNKCYNTCTIGGSYCNDSTDGCSVCANTGDQYNPGARCTTPAYYCAYKCSANSGPCYDACILANAPKSYTTCDRCYISCLSNPQICSSGTSCKSCYNTGYGFGYCIPSAEKQAFALQTKAAVERVIDQVEEEFNARIRNARRQAEANYDASLKSGDSIIRMNGPAMSAILDLSDLSAAFIQQRIQSELASLRASLANKL